MAHSPGHVACCFTVPDEDTVYQGEIVLDPDRFQDNRIRVFFERQFIARQQPEIIADPLGQHDATELVQCSFHAANINWQLP
jgi:hypothetical protein